MVKFKILMFIISRGVFGSMKRYLDYNVLGPDRKSLYLITGSQHYSVLAASLSISSCSVVFLRMILQGLMMGDLPQV